MPRNGFDIPDYLDLGPARRVAVTEYRWSRAHALIVLNVRLELGNQPRVIGNPNWQTIIEAGIDLRNRIITSVTPQAISDIEARLYVALA